MPPYTLFKLKCSMLIDWEASALSQFPASRGKRRSEFLGTTFAVYEWLVHHPHIMWQYIYLVNISSSQCFPISVEPVTITVRGSSGRMALGLRSLQPDSKWLYSKPLFESCLQKSQYKVTFATSDFIRFYSGQCRLHCYTPCQHTQRDRDSFAFVLGAKLGK